MIPIRILLVEDALPVLRELRTELDEAGTFEVFTAASSAAGLLGLARTRPDVLIFHPYAGRGSVEDWRRAIARCRASRALGVLAMADKIPLREREILSGLADLGIVGRRPSARLVHKVVDVWAGEWEQALGKAA